MVRSNYLNLNVEAIKQETEDTVSLLLKEKDDRDMSFFPGQFLTFIFNSNGEEVRRGYSIASSPDELPFLRVAIKKVKGGYATHHLLDSIHKNQRIKSLPPMGAFTIKPAPNIEREIVMFGAGSGLTPLISMIYSVLQNEPKSKIDLIYGNRNEDSIIFKDELEGLVKKYPDRFNLIYSLSLPSDNWNGLKGRITKEKTLDIISDLKIDSPEKIDYYLCGPEGMRNNVIEALTELNVGHDKIHKENFTIKIIEDDEEIEEIPREVTLIIHGERKRFVVDPGESIMEKGLTLGIDIPNSCQYGNCTTCKAKLLSGKLKLVDQTGLTEEEIQQGYCLTCIGYPASDNIVILYEDEF
jgi:ring-1,2-phenylacetyl-CoA epoxidase subunit PaaE